MVKGSPVIIDAVCSAPKPQPISNTAATAPSVPAQKIRCPTGESSFPPEVNASTTRDPE